MSTSPSGLSNNPYSAPQASIEQLGAVPLRPRLPVFCIVVFSVDMLFCLLRLALVGAGVLGYMMMLEAGNSDPMVITAPFEIATGAVIAFGGLLANSGFLFRQSWAVFVAYLVVVATVGSIGVGIWQLSVMIDQLPGGEAQRIGAMVGGGLMAMFRFALLGLYVAAVLRFRQWKASAA